MWDETFFLIAAICKLIGIIWIYGRSGFIEDIEMMTGAEVDIMALVRSLLIIHYAYPFDYNFYLVTSKISKTQLYQNPIEPKSCSSLMYECFLQYLHFNYVYHKNNSY